MKVFTPVRPTISTITEYFFNKNPDKIRNLRVDTLSQLLSLANVHANSKLLVIDDTQGLIVASVLERMGGYGQLVALHEGDNHNYDILRYMNYPKSVQNVLQTVPFAMLDPETPDGKRVYLFALLLIVCMSLTISTFLDPFDILTDEQYDNLEDDDHRRAYLRRKTAWGKKVKSRQLLHEGDFDGLIISSALQPETVLKELMKYVCGSRPVVIYSFNKEVLLHAAYWMRRSNDFLNSELTESSLREYQVLPGRMHPNMNMSCGGGYLLSALRVIDCPFDPSLVKKGDNLRFKKKKKTNNNEPAVQKEEASEQ
jgi:tRNA (adenine-N(1)-)-methyltransferase non-catalytic subunit